MFSKTLLVLLLVYFLFDFSHGRRNQSHFRNDYNYIDTFESYYKFHNTPKKWRDAKRVCSEEGASLFYPENTDEAKAVMSLRQRSRTDAQPTYATHAQRKYAQVVPTTWVFVGMSDIITEGVYETIDGKSISEVHNHWNSNQPDNFNDNEDCVHMYEGGELNDTPCDSKYSFICKKSFQSIDRTDCCTIEQSNLGNLGHKKETSFRNDYSYIEAFGSYYKFHSTPKQWRVAKRVCSEEGASLFYPKNFDEADAVISFWKRAKTDAQPGTTWVFVGMSDIITEGVYETIDGKSISEVYKYWNSDQPDNLKDEEDCVHMYEGGQLNDIPCDSKYSFICKKSFPSFDRSCSVQPSYSDYSFSETVGNFYKLHTTPLTWTEAYDVCRLELSHLAVINSALEADYLTKLTKSVKQRFGKTYQNGIYHLGVHSVPDHGWQTITGQNISDAGALWANLLSTADDDKQCASMSSSGLLSKIDCNKKGFFICEHEVNDPTESTFSLDNEEDYE